MQQLPVDPCCCGTSNAVCPVHPPMYLAPSNLQVPSTIPARLLIHNERSLTKLSSMTRIRTSSGDFLWAGNFLLEVENDDCERNS